MLFLCFYLLFCLLTFKDYGIAADEDTWYIQAGRYVKHYVHRATDLDESGGIFGIQQASHNYIYPAVLRVICPKKADDYHLANLLFVLPIYFALYGALLLAYRKPWFAFLGPVFLFLFFRFTGDVPINPKDGPFAVFYFFGLTWIYLSRYRIKDLRLESIVLGVLIGLATTIRSVGITLLPILVIYRLYEYYVDQNVSSQKFDLKEWFAKEWLNFTLVFIISQCWIMAFWPYLGGNYFGNLLNVFLQSKAYEFDFPMIFMGHPISALHRPWYYLIVWYGICTPLFILSFFFSSFWLFRKKLATMAGKFYALLAFTFICQLLLYLLLQPIIYNSMRHYLFIAPIMSAMAAMAFIEFVTEDYPKLFKRGVVTLVIFNVLLVVIEFFRLYPYHYVYFNELVGGLKGAEGRYETEYWNTSFKEASEWLANNVAVDPKKTYRIKLGGTPWQELEYFKPNMLGDVDMKNPEYEILELKRDMAPLTSNQKMIYVVTREDVPFVRVIQYTSVEESGGKASAKK
jgi:hypothetical protein